MTEEGVGEREEHSRKQRLSQLGKEDHEMTVPHGDGDSFLELGAEASK